MIDSIPKLVGVVNLSEDSFFDGGRFTKPHEAVKHAFNLVEDGAFVVELGAASSHPDAAPVGAQEEIAHLEPVLDGLIEADVRVGVDSFQPATQRFALSRGASFLNDIEGFAHEEIYPDLAASDCTLVVMHSVQRGGPATRTTTDAAAVLTAMYDFFETRINALQTAGIVRTRMILDPGMGFFLGDGAKASVLVLQKLDRLRDAFGIPVLVSVSHKSFLGNLTDRGVQERGAATLAAELYAAGKGVDYIRTHNVAALSDALTVWNTLETSN